MGCCLFDLQFARDNAGWSPTSSNGGAIGEGDDIHGKARIARGMGRLLKIAEAEL